MESVTYQELSNRAKEEWMQKGGRIGIEKGERIGIEKGIQEGIVEVLEERFGEVSGEVREGVRQIREIRLLQRLLRDAVRVSSIDEFATVLAQAGGEKRQ